MTMEPVDHCPPSPSRTEHPAITFSKALLCALWDGGEPGSDEILALAEECGVLKRVPWIPAAHGEHASPDAVPGDPICIFSDAMVNLPSPANDPI
jgi:hypothetical protein